MLDAPRDLPSDEAPAPRLEPDRQYRVLIDHSPDAIVVHEGHELVFVNPAGLRLIGASSADQVVGHPLAEFVHQRSVAALLERITSLDHPGAASEPTEMVLRRLGGRLIDVEARSVSTTWDGRPAFLAILRDLTALKAAQAATQTAEQLYTAVVATLAEGVMVLDRDGVVRSINPAGMDILGLDGSIVDADRPNGLTHRLSVTDADGVGLTFDDYSYVRSQRQNAPTTFVNCVRRPDGDVVWTRGTTQAISPGRDDRLVVSFSDITAEREASARLEYQATHDSLTDLPNRAHVVSTLSAALDDLDRGPVTVLFIDLDNLKAVNDSLGHSLGDDILRTVGARLRDVVPTDGIVGRVGGDEFVAVVPGDRTLVESVSERVHTALARPIELDGWTLRIGASIGAVGVPAGDPRTIDDLLRDADLAMYAAKSDGGERTVHFSARLRRERSPR